MTYHYDFDDEGIIKMCNFLNFLQKLEIVKFKRLDVVEHWLSASLIIEFNQKDRASQLREQAP